MKKFIAILCFVCMIGMMFVGCEVDTTSNGSRQDTLNQQESANRLQTNQQTPTDIEYSLERYNLIRRTYWVNGQREKANALPCEVEKPFGYIVLFGESGAVLSSFVVDGKVSSLNSFLTPDSMYYEVAGDYVGNNGSGIENEWLADVDGSYGENDNGIFFFTPDGKYIEWTGIYLYSDIPFIVEDPVLKVGETNE